MLFLFLSTTFTQTLPFPRLKQYIYQKPKLSVELVRCRARSDVIPLQPKNPYITRLWTWWNICYFTHSKSLFSTGFW